jgi:hypothetical protein
MASTARHRQQRWPGQETAGGPAHNGRAMLLAPSRMMAFKLSHLELKFITL